MKKLFAITLLTIYLFNLVGYSMLFGWLQQKTTNQLEANIIHRHFDENDLVEIKVPLPVAVPYLESWPTYEPIAGEINVDGKHLSYVKRKITRDTLYLMVLPNAGKDELQSAKTAFGQKANDFDGNKKQNGAKKELSYPQFRITQNEYVLNSPEAALAPPAGFLTSPLPLQVSTAAENPPEGIVA